MAFPDSMQAFAYLEDIDLDTLLHLLLIDPVRQFSPWYFSLRNHLRRIDPRYEELFGGSLDPSLYPYERQLSRLLVFLCRDIDSLYAIGGPIRRNKLHTGSACLQSLADCYLFDQLDHARRLEAYLQSLPTRPPRSPGQRSDGLSCRPKTLRETFSAATPITKTTASVPISRQVPCHALEEGNLSLGLSMPAQFDGVSPSVISGISTLSSTQLAPAQFECPVAMGPSPPSLTIEAPSDTSTFEFHAESACTAPLGSFTPLPPGPVIPLRLTVLQPHIIDLTSQEDSFGSIPVEDFGVSEDFEKVNIPEATIPDIGLNLKPTPHLLDEPFVVACLAFMATYPHVFYLAPPVEAAINDDVSSASTYVLKASRKLLAPS